MYYLRFERMEKEGVFLTLAAAIWLWAHFFALLWPCPPAWGEIANAIGLLALIWAVCYAKRVHALWLNKE